MQFDLSNKTIVVTGATKGIGLAISNLLIEYGAKIIATGTQLKKIEKLNKKLINKNITYKYLDFNSNESVENFIVYIKKQVKIFGLVNNAGINKIDSIFEAKQEDWDLINNVNLRGPFILTRAISSLMKANGIGRIVNIASIFSVVSKQKRVSYATSKWGLIGFTKSIALDLARYNILVNAVSPGFVDTKLTRKILNKDEIEFIKKTIPQRRLAKPEEIAKIILFLISEQNSYITAQNILIDGGFTSE